MFSRMLLITAGGWRGGGEERCDIVDVQRKGRGNERIYEERGTYGFLNEKKKFSCMARLSRSARMMR